METPPPNPGPSSGTMSRLELKIDALHIQLSDIREYVMGPFGESHKGLDARVRKLEQSEQGRKKITATAIVATVGAIVTSLWNWLAHGGHPQP